MRIIKPSAEVIEFTPEGETLIEQCGRVAYQSSRIDTKRFIEMLIKRGHESVLEHASATVLIVCDRGVSHELVRHRLVAYTQESTRYCRYKDEITVICPPGLAGDSYDDWRDCVTRAEHAYLLILESGISPQIARSVLPTCLKTQIAMTANLREWRHVIKLRCSEAAHPQMREIMFIVRDALKGIYPSVFGDL